MFKKFFTYPVFLIIVISIICSILFGGLIKYHFDGGRKYQSLQKTGMFFASIPISIYSMIKYKSINFDKPPILSKHKDKKRFKQFISNKRNALLVLPRYDHSLNRSVIDIIDLNNFKNIHTYKHNVSEMHKQITNTDEFLVKKRDPLILPPEYDNLPKPNSNASPKATDENKINKILKLPDQPVSTTTAPSSVEDSIIRNIKK